MSDEHKTALAIGREQGRAVRAYLDAVEAHRPKRGRKRTEETVRKQLQTVEKKLSSASSLDKVLLTQERINLQNELAGMGAAVDLSGLEDGFVKAAKEYGERKGLSYAAWRGAGIDAAVLTKAGISRGAG